MQKKPAEIQTNTSCYYHNLAKPNRWMAYQSWRKVIFLHWAFDPEMIAPYLPRQKYLQLDTFEGKAWVSVVAFEVCNAHLRISPVLPGLSGFTELNLRTYARLGDRAGTVFLRLCTNTLLSTLVYKMSGLPYYNAKIGIEGKSDLHFKSRVGDHENNIDVSWQNSEEPYTKTALDTWLTERYCTYQQVCHKPYRYPICHLPWKLNRAALTKADIQYRWNNIILNSEHIALAHYSDGVDTLFYMRQNISNEEPL